MKITKQELIKLYEKKISRIIDAGFEGCDYLGSLSEDDPEFKATEERLANLYSWQKMYERKLARISQ